MSKTNLNSTILPIKSADAPKVHKQNYLLIEKRESILYIRINRPEVKNAVNRSTFYQLIAVLDHAKYDKSVSMVVLSGVGDYFCAGSDLRQIHQYPNAEAFFQPANYILKAVIKEILKFPKIIVALVNGPAIGIGFTMCGLCDIVYCTDNAYFSAPFSALGLCAEACSSYTLPLILGQSVAAEILILGERLTAERAYQLGFVARIFGKDEIESDFWPKMLAYTKLSKDSMRATKKLMKLPQYEVLIQALEAECKELAKLRRSEEHLKALAKYSGKNKSKL